ncbi:MAG: hypothetical protein ACR2KZ_17575 [Segetibacter sp.]
MEQFVLVVDGGSDWAAIYKEGQRIDSGHIDDMQGRLIKLLGVLTESAVYNDNKQPDGKRGKWDRFKWPDTLTDVKVR